MSSTSNPRVQLIDSDGDKLDNGAGKLNVTGTLTTEVGYGAPNLATYDFFEVPTSSATIGSLTAEVAILNKIIVQADHENTTWFMIGGASTSSTGTLNGFRMYPGDMFMIDNRDSETIRIEAPSAGQNISVGLQF